MPSSPSPTLHPTTAPGPKAFPSISCWSTTPACRPARRRWSACAMRQVQVSAHYLVEEDGTVFSLVPEDRRAWHAGAGYWQGERDINSRSVGVELVNPGHEWGYRPFPDAQMAAFAALARGIMDRHGILPHRVLAHSDVAPSRKEDPGELFDWRGLAARGIGFWPTPCAAGRRAGPCRGGGPGPAGAVRLRGRADRSTRSAEPESPRRRSSGTSFPTGSATDSTPLSCGCCGRR